MKKQLLSITALLLLGAAAQAQVVESFEPIPGQSISIKDALEQQNWQFPEFDINPEGATPISGSQSIGADVASFDNSQPTGVVTPYLDFSNTETLTFNYKIHRALMQDCRRWFLINLIDQNDVVTLVDSVEIDGNQVSAANYSLDISGYAGTYAIYANVRGEGCNAKLVVDDVSFTGSLASIGGKPNLKAEQATGIGNAKANDKTIAVYPNPAKDNLNINIDAEKSGNATVEVFAMDGTKLIAQETNVNSGSNQVQLTVSNLSAGNYIVSVRTADGVATKRFAIAG